MTKYKNPFLLLFLALSLSLFGCGSDSDKSSDEPESAIVKMAQSDPSMQQFADRPGLNSDIGFDTTKLDDYRLVARLDYPNGNPRQLTIGLDKTDKAPILMIRYDENGNRTEEVESYGRKRNGRALKWYPNSNLNAIEHFKDEKLCDTSVLFWDNGFYKQKVTYKDGVKNGLWEQYSENGVKLKQGLYVNDSLNGPYTAWDQTGRLEYTGFYKDNMMSGKWEKYYPSGRIKALTNYEEGKRNGTYIVWDEMGFPMGEQFYVNGERTDWPDSIPHAKAVNPPELPISPEMRDSLERKGLEIK